METRADRAYGCANRARHLLHREVAVEAKDDGGSLIGVEAAEGSLEAVALGDLEMAVIRGSKRSCSIQIVMSPETGAPETVTTDVDEDPSEPGIELLGIAEAVMFPPSSDERVVGRILGLLCVAEDQPGEAVGRVEALVDKPLEGCGSRRLRVRRDGSGFLAQAGLTLRAVCRPLPIPTHGWPETFTGRVLAARSTIIS
jgi:hypothetical protein